VGNKARGWERGSARLSSAQQGAAIKLLAVLVVSTAPLESLLDPELLELLSSVLDDSS
jgi:hypothetical protein